MQSLYINRRAKYGYKIVSRRYIATKFRYKLQYVPYNIQHMKTANTHLEKHYEDLDIPIEKYFDTFILPFYDIHHSGHWLAHYQTSPDSFVHVFTYDNKTYALTYDDYPSGFSVSDEDFAKPIKLPNDAYILSVTNPQNNFAINIIGHFVLFKILDKDKFNARISQLVDEYKEWSAEAELNTKTLVSVSRDALRLAENASHNEDTHSLYALSNIIDALIFANAQDNSIDLQDLRQYVEYLSDTDPHYKSHDLKDEEELRKKIYSNLGASTNENLQKQRKFAKKLGSPIQLITVMYVRHTGKDTEGTSITIITDGDEIQFPASHFLDTELREYLADNPYIVPHNIKDNFPGELGDFTIVEGSIAVRKILRQELAYISF